MALDIIGRPKKIRRITGSKFLQALCLLFIALRLTAYLIDTTDEVPLTLREWLNGRAK